MNRRNFIGSVIGGLASAVAAPLALAGRGSLIITPTGPTTITLPPMSPGTKLYIGTKDGLYTATTGDWQWKRVSSYETTAQFKLYRGTNA